ncbi:putative GTP diphosphokinase RSH1, chloroplastic [Andrographis paniculata]|uniref:putative GTP diphosphokinase RSH1, chloroplastic n=1 Tax=Andrographis paniculata TaxID=175694 RepID=UPI0021E8E634|nr:putative GTP diphosphokinase RSH1, chloroplastic [Andrographis paniculata]
MNCDVAAAISIDEGLSESSFYKEMGLIAERGIAAHYSGKVFVNGRNSRGKTVCLNNENVALREEFLGNMSSREFVDTITRDLLGSRCFVFTPKGETKNLPEGATAIDYAYMIHSDIGYKMVAAEPKMFLCRLMETRSARLNIMKIFQFQEVILNTAVQGEINSEALSKMVGRCTDAKMDL